MTAFLATLAALDTKVLTNLTATLADLSDRLDAWTVRFLTRPRWPKAQRTPRAEGRHRAVDLSTAQRVAASQADHEWGMALKGIASRMEGRFVSWQ